MKHFFLMFALAACGSSSKEKTYSGSLGSCLVQVVGDDTQQVCIDFSYSGKLKNDPRAETGTEARKVCTDIGTETTKSLYNYFESKACELGKTLGTCTFSKTVLKDGQNATMLASMTFAGSSMDTSVAKVRCDDAAGTYTAP